MLNEFNPKVSIVIPVYNGSNFLAEAIESALAQTYENKEILVVNDGSNDNGATEKIAKQYGDKIQYYFKENGGVSSALNFGIQKMTGEYFSWLSHDDLYTPEKVANSIELLRLQTENRAKSIAYVDGFLVNEQCRKIKKFKRRFQHNTIYSGVEATEIMAKTGTLCGCCFLIPKIAFEEIGFFDETLRYSQDTLMWYRLFLNDYSLCVSLSANVLSRVHKQQVTHTRKDLFLHDSLCVAKELAPLFREKNMSDAYFSYIKRLTRLNCEPTINYLLEYGQTHELLTEKCVQLIRKEEKKGQWISKIKRIARNIIVK